MNIVKEKQGNAVVLKPEGRLDTVTAPAFEEEIKKTVADTKELIIDLSGTVYISSAGLRVLLSAQKMMNKQGTMKVRGANDSIMEVFDVTGFVDLLNIE